MYKNMSKFRSVELLVFSFKTTRGEICLCERESETPHLELKFVPHVENRCEA